MTDSARLAKIVASDQEETSRCGVPSCVCHTRQFFLSRLEAIGAASRRGHAAALGVPYCSGSVMEFFVAVDSGDSLMDALDQECGITLEYETNPDPIERESNVLPFVSRPRRTP